MINLIGTVDNPSQVATSVVGNTISANNSIVQKEIKQEKISDIL